MLVKPVVLVLAEWHHKSSQEDSVAWALLDNFRIPSSFLIDGETSSSIAGRSPSQVQGLRGVRDQLTPCHYLEAAETCSGSLLLDRIWLHAGARDISRSSREIHWNQRPHPQS